MPAEPASAFGLALDSDLALPGVAGGGGSGLRPTAVRRAEARELDLEWPRAAARVLSEEVAEDGSRRTVAVAGEAGYRLDAPGFGLAHVSADGSLVRCAPPGGEEDGWRWQRFLVGRVLPFAATLAGLEPLHAGAVVVGDRAVAVLGPTGTGKSSVTARLMLAGAQFLTDDVLALEPTADGGVLAHPGAATVAVRDAEAVVLGERIAALGEPTGAGGGKHYLRPARAAGPVPLGAVVLLRRGADALAVRRVERLDARELLRSAFVPEVRTPGRMLGQLELVSRIAHSVVVLEVDATPSADAGDVAELILAELEPACAR
jgi:hypothetical protein